MSPSQRGIQPRFGNEDTHGTLQTPFYSKVFKGSCHPRLKKIFLLVLLQCLCLTTRPRRNNLMQQKWCQRICGLWNFLCKCDSKAFAFMLYWHEQYSTLAITALTLQPLPPGLHARCCPEELRPVTPRWPPSISLLLPPYSSAMTQCWQLFNVFFPFGLKYLDRRCIVSLFCSFQMRPSPAPLCKVVLFYFLL